MIDESTKTLNLTQTLYDNYTSLLSTSSHLVKAIEKADWYDRLLIFAAFFFFLLVVGWVIKRRVLDKVVGGVGWWVGGSWKLVSMGLGRGGSKKGAGGVLKGVSSAVASASASVAASGASRVSDVVKSPREPMVEAETMTGSSSLSYLLDEVAPTDNPSSAVNKPDTQKVKNEL